MKSSLLKPEFCSCWEGKEGGKKGGREKEEERDAFYFRCDEIHL